MLEGTLIRNKEVFGEKLFYFKKEFKVGNLNMILAVPQFGAQMPYNFVKSMVEVVHNDVRPLKNIKQDTLLILLKKNNKAAKQEFIIRMKERK